MIDDIKSDDPGNFRVTSNLQGRFTHEHKWRFLVTKSNFKEVAGGFEQVHYSFFACYDCPDVKEGPNVIMKLVKEVKDGND